MVISVNYSSFDSSCIPLEENLKKAVTEFLVLKILSERECYIGEISEEIARRSGGVITIVFPYAAIYRLLDNGYLTEVRKRLAPDGRRRQYYQITDFGRKYLNELEQLYHRMISGISAILDKKELND